MRLIYFENAKPEDGNKKVRSLKPEIKPKRMRCRRNPE